MKKTVRVIVTRDNSYNATPVTVWPENAKGLRLSPPDRQFWTDDDADSLFELSTTYALKVFPGLPRKGRKAIYEIRKIKEKP